MSQTTESFLRIAAIFHEALEASEEARPELIAMRCKGDRQMADEVNSLLEACMAEETETASHRTGSEVGREVKAEPRRVGPYQLDGLVGRGGMGAVFLALGVRLALASR